MKHTLVALTLSAALLSGCASKEIPSAEETKKPAPVPVPAQESGRVSASDLRKYDGLDAETKGKLSEILKRHEEQANAEVLAAADRIYNNHGIRDYTTTISNNPAKKAKIEALINDEATFRESVAAYSKQMQSEQERLATAKAECLRAETSAARARAEEVLAYAAQRKVMAENATLTVERDALKADIARMNAAMEAVRALNPEVVAAQAAK